MCVEATTKLLALDEKLRPRIDQAYTSKDLAAIEDFRKTQTELIYAGLQEKLKRFKNPELNAEKILLKRHPEEAPQNRPIMEEISLVSTMIKSAEEMHPAREATTPEDKELANNILQKHVKAYMEQHPVSEFKSNQDQIRAMYDTISYDVKRECYLEHGLEVSPGGMLKEMKHNAKQKDLEIEAFSKAKSSMERTEEAPQKQAKTTDDLTMNRGGFGL